MEIISFTFIPTSYNLI